uniref:Uncharacterized protein n=1 Tax=Klebsiella pneumoniae TaxID=573 RepID=A0A6G9HRW1_KLEPN|nr:hypothetical protein [Klebsiella pneumoniae]
MPSISALLQPAIADEDEDEEEDEDEDEEGRSNNHHHHNEDKRQRFLHLLRNKYGTARTDYHLVGHNLNHCSYCT